MTKTLNDEETFKTYDYNITEDDSLDEEEIL